MYNTGDNDSDKTHLSSHSLSLPVPPSHSLKINKSIMNKKQYTTPTLTVVTFKAERGYAESLFAKARTVSITSLFTGEPVISNQENWGAEQALFDDDTWSD